MDDIDENLGFEVFPNPTNGFLTLRFDEVGNAGEVVVYNVLGQRIATISCDEAKHNEITYVLPEVSSGWYYFVLRSEKKALVRKVLLER